MIETSTSDTKDLIKTKFPDAILLDIDNTLYDYDSCHIKALDDAGLFFSETFNIPFLSFLEFYDAARKSIHTRLKGTASSHNRLLYFQTAIEMSGHGSSIRDALELYDIYWRTFLDNITVFDGVYEFIHIANGMKIPIVFITDLTADVQFKKLNKLSLDNKFHSIVTSEEAGIEKPSKNIFEMALTKLNTQTASIWMVGDDYKKDIIGGKSVGAFTFLKVNNKHAIQTLLDPAPDLIFHDFTELIEQLNTTVNNVVI